MTIELVREPWQFDEFWSFTEDVDGGVQRKGLMEIREAIEGVIDQIDPRNSVLPMVFSTISIPAADGERNVWFVTAHGKQGFEEIGVKAIYLGIESKLALKENPPAGSLNMLLIDNGDLNGWRYITPLRHLPQS